MVVPAPYYYSIIIAKKSAGRLQKKDNSRTESSAHGIGILLLYDAVQGSTRTPIGRAVYFAR